MLVYLLAALQIAAAPSSSQEPQPVIWREFREGITPEQFAEGLRKAEGISSVEVTRKGKKPAKIKIAYAAGNGMQIGDLNVTVTPSFINDRLGSVTLSETSCYSTVEAKLEKLVTALGEKYPQQQRVKVVNTDGVSVDTQRAFNNQETRVTVSVSPIENPYPQHIYGGTGFMASLNKVANSMADSTYNSNIEGCPIDKGRKATLQLEYVSQGAFMAEHLKESADQAAKAKATRDGL
jgi:hypothetical protein